MTVFIFGGTIPIVFETFENVLGKNLVSFTLP